MSFRFHRETTVAMLHQSLLTSDLVLASERVCPANCPFRDLDEDTLHIHLTKPTGGRGDSVFVLNLPNPDSPGGIREKLLERARVFRSSWAKQNYELDEGSKPGLRFIGLRVFLGEPLE